MDCTECEGQYDNPQCAEVCPRWTIPACLRNRVVGRIGPRGGKTMKISRDSDVVELAGPPAFEFGEKVRARLQIRNDGTFPGKDIGDILVKKGDIAM